MFCSKLAQGSASMYYIHIEHQQGINVNYYIINNYILRAKTMHMPDKPVKLNNYKHKQSMCITKGINTILR